MYKDMYDMKGRQRMKKKWLLPIIAAFLLAACSEEDETQQQSDEAAETFESVVADNAITITPIATPNEDVQGVIDMTEETTFASFIYSMSDDSYLILNSNEEVSVTADDSERVLNLHLNRSGNAGDRVETTVYAVAFAHEYDTIMIFEDGEEIPFDIWTE